MVVSVSARWIRSSRSCWLIGLRPMLVMAGICRRGMCWARMAQVRNRRSSGTWMLDVEQVQIGLRCVGESPVVVGEPRTGTPWALFHAPAAPLRLPGDSGCRRAVACRAGSCCQRRNPALDLTRPDRGEATIAEVGVGVPLQIGLDVRSCRRAMNLCLAPCFRVLTEGCRVIEIDVGAAYNVCGDGRQEALGVNPTLFLRCRPSGSRHRTSQEVPPSRLRRWMLPIDLGEFSVLRRSRRAVILRGEPGPDVARVVADVTAYAPATGSVAPVSPLVERCTGNSEEGCDFGPRSRAVLARPSHSPNVVMPCDVKGEYCDGQSGGYVADCAGAERGRCVAKLSPLARLLEAITEARSVAPRDAQAGFGTWSDHARSVAVGTADGDHRLDGVRGAH
jgi:hypothetical protein